MAEHLTLILIWSIPLVLLLGSFCISRVIEGKRKRYLLAAEAELADIPCVALRTSPEELELIEEPLVCAEAAIANSYMRSFFAGFVNFFGGEIRSYTRLADDARRLALVRLKRRARECGGEYIYNVRFEGISLSSPSQAANRQQNTGGLQIIVYGTALRRKRV